MVVEEFTDYYVTFFIKGDAILWDDNPEWAKGYMGVSDMNGENLGDHTVPHYCDGGVLGDPWAAGELVFGEGQMMLPWRDYVYKFNSGPYSEVFMFIGTYVNREVNWKLDGFKVYKSLSGATAVEREGDIIPDEYALSQNYPNPFNPTTILNFSILESGNVKLAIYDALGREVELLVDQKMNAGNYNAEWNASSYAAGIYFYSISVNDFTSTKKMVLLK